MSNNQCSQINMNVSCFSYNKGTCQTFSKVSMSPLFNPEEPLIRRGNSASMNIQFDLSFESANKDAN